MPKFFFHLNGEPDFTGYDLPSIKAAKSTAANYAAGVLCDEADHFWEGDADLDLWVADERGATLFALQIIAAEAPIIRGLG